MTKNYLNLKSCVLILIMIAFCYGENFAQRIQYADLAVTGGTILAIAPSYVNNWKLNIGRRDRLEAGFGLRLSSAFGKNIEYITAGPAKYTRGNTTPFVIVFATQLPENWDTVTVNKAQVNALNLSANFGYNITDRLGLGFNIDLVGFSFGGSSEVIYESNNAKTSGNAKPTAFNALLTGDHDLGSLNSEFFIKYRFGEHWGARALYQFLFTEYTTTDVEQTFFDGEKTDRFRNKGNNFGLAAFYTF